MTLDELNRVPADEAFELFRQCCGSRIWAEEMADARPFVDLDAMRSMADGIWWELKERDWLEAFASHPKIGEKKAATATGDKAVEWSSEEQGSLAEGSVAARLADLNREYEKKFGFIYIVFATGKSQEEMLELLEQRIENDREKELPIAATEQMKITDLRLEKLVSS